MPGLKAVGGACLYRGSLSEFPSGCRTVLDTDCGGVFAYPYMWQNVTELHTEKKKTNACKTNKIQIQPVVQLTIPRCPNPFPSPSLPLWPKPSCWPLLTSPHTPAPSLPPWVIPSPRLTHWSPLVSPFTAQEGDITQWF